MFTGIIRHFGVVQQRTRAGLRVAAPKGLIKQITKGDSVAVNGVCLSVVKIAKPRDFFADVMPETWAKTALGDLAQGARVNLELPATAHSFLSGHLVQGHVDATASVKSIRRSGNSRIFTFSLPKALGKYLVHKGSVAINGISLTVIKASRGQFSAGIVPHTWRHTALSEAKAGDRVNLEVDILAKYLKRLLGRY